MIIDQRIKRKHIFTACNRTCMESKADFFLKSRTADFGNTVLIATKKVQSYLNCSYRELKKET